MTLRNHSLNFIALAGILGGIVMSLLLAYPAFTVMPGIYVDGLYTGDAVTGMRLAGFAMLIPFVTGWLAARLSGTSWQGAAVAGGVAGAIFYSAVGVLAVGFLSAESAFVHGTAPAMDEAHFMQLVTESVVYPVIWIQLGMPVTVFFSALLAAIGGTVYLNKSGEKVSTLPALVPAVFFTLVAASTMMVTVVIYALLDDAVRNVMLEFDTGIPLIAADMIYLVPTGLALLAYLGGLLAIYSILRHAIMQQGMRFRMGLILGLLVLGGLFTAIMFLIHPVNEAIELPFAVGMFASLILLLMIYRLARFAWQRGSDSEAISLWQLGKDSFPGSILLSATGIGSIMMSGVLAPLFLVVMTVAMIPTWVQYEDTLLEQGTTYIVPEMVGTIENSVVSLIVLYPGITSTVYGTSIIMLISFAGITWGLIRLSEYLYRVYQQRRRSRAAAI